MSAVSLARVKKLYYNNKALGTFQRHLVSDRMPDDENKNKNRGTLFK